MVSQLPLLVIALACIALPSLVEGALFPAKSNVRHVDPNGFRQALKDERTFVVAFVAPWCGHCQKVAPELIRAADGLHPLVPVYAVDCDDAKNKPLCAEQDVKGFPTIKLFPQGTKVPPLEFEGTRTASSFFYWASRAVPASKVSRTQNAKGVGEIVAKNPGKPKAILMNKTNKSPLLWRVLSNIYGDKIVFGNCRDRQGRESVALGFEAGLPGQAKVLVYGRESKEPVLYEGILKLSALSEFFDQVIDGSIDINRANLNAKEQVLKVPESERKALDDETRIGDAGYAGFNPHEGLDMEELMKHGMKNPHAPHHPGGANPHAGGNAGAKNPSESTSAESSSSSEAMPSSSYVEASLTSGSATSAFMDNSSARNAAPTTKLAETDISADVAKGTEHVTEHSKDEL